MLAAAAADLVTIDSSLGAAHTAAAASTVALVPAAADEVSASIAHLFSQHAGDYQAVARQAAAFHAQFIQNLNTSTRSYASTEAANTSSLRLLDVSTGPHVSANVGAQNQSPSQFSQLLPVTVPSGEAIAVLVLGFLLLPVVFLLLPVELPLALLLLILTGQLRIF